jgi:uncharacterized RDD family membrane protein YckC
VRAVLDAVVHVATAENIAFRYQIAGPFRRFPALALDVAIRALGLFVLAIAVLWVTPAVRGLGSLAFAMGLLIWFAAEWFYGGLFETYWNGQTPGKRLLRLRVLSVDGRPINGLQAILRNILRSVDLMPVVPLVAGEQYETAIIPTCFVGLACLASTRHFQRLGDIVCGTMVVVEEQVRAPIRVDRISPGVVAVERQIPVSFRPDRKLTRALALYIERRDQFSATRRHELARHVAQLLIRRWELPSDTDHDDLMTALYRIRFRGGGPTLVPWERGS